MEVMMVKTLGGQLAPLNETEAERLRTLKTGSVIEVKITRKRNPDFHRKFFALLGTAFDAWTEVAPELPPYRGQPVRPNLDRFRKDITILAGFYEPVYSLKGEVRLEAKSISFANMEQEEFERLYSAVIGVVLEKILTARGYTEESLRRHVDSVLAFDR